MLLTTKQLAAASEADLRATNSTIVAEIRSRMKATQREKASTFALGQKVKFFVPKMCKHITIEIDRINPSSLSGRCVDDGRKWRVAPSLTIPA